MIYPVYCPACDFEKEIQCELKDYEKEKKKWVCPECGAHLERDMSKNIASVSWSTLGPGSYHYEYKHNHDAAKKIVGMQKKGLKFGEERLRENQRKYPEIYGKHDMKTGSDFVKNRKNAKAAGLA